MRSLVAEDDVTNRVLLQKFLSRFGQCDIAFNGKDAVNAIRAARQERQSYDLVCMDLRMPEMDGNKAIHEIRAQEAAECVYNPVIIIVTTSCSDTESIKGALLGPCNAYLVKPINTARLLDELKKLGMIKKMEAAS